MRSDWSAVVGKAYLIVGEEAEHRDAVAKRIAVKAEAADCHLIERHKGDQLALAFTADKGSDTEDITFKGVADLVKAARTTFTVTIFPLSWLNEGMVSDKNLDLPDRCTIRCKKFQIGR